MPTLGIIGVVVIALVGGLIILGQVRMARRVCPACGARGVSLIDVISDGGVWKCRACGHEWR